MKALMILVAVVALCSAGTMAQNPVADSATFYSSEMSEPGGDVYMMDFDGVPIYWIPTGGGRQEVSFAVDDLLPGTYFMAVCVDGKVKDSAIFTKL